MTQAPVSRPRFVIRSRPEDFVVVEEPLYAASGAGGHLFVEIEKRGRTTEQVARELARCCGVAPMEVGYAGRKDRHAVTRQWFSVPGVEPERALEITLEGAQVLGAVRHEHKLKTGHLRGNRFELVVGSDTPVDFPTLEARAEELVRRGMPNRYGEQRFGRAGDNAEAARKLFAGRSARRDLRAARFLVSALQAEVFNAVLAERSEGYDDVLVGDLARVEVSGGLFWVDDLERERPRARAFEISATGPIFGTKVREPRGEVAVLEARVLERHGIPPASELSLPRGLRALGTRRPLRVQPRDLVLTPVADGRGFRLVCGLPPGAYVTVLLESLVGELGVVVDGSRGRLSPDEESAAGVSSPDAD
jgi:tRNA pseudouridine13 synthase